MRKNSFSVFRSSRAIDKFVESKRHGYAIRRANSGFYGGNMRKICDRICQESGNI